MKGNDDFKFEVIEDLGSFGDGAWSKHLALVSFNGAEPVYDIRTWNEDMTKMGKRCSLTMEDLLEIHDIIEEKFLS